jgi:hypothetical protein
MPPRTGATRQAAAAAAAAYLRVEKLWFALMYSVPSTTCGWGGQQGRAGVRRGGLRGERRRATSGSTYRQRPPPPPHLRLDSGHGRLLPGQLHAVIAARRHEHIHGCAGHDARKRLERRRGRRGEQPDQQEQEPRATHGCERHLNLTSFELCSRRGRSWRVSGSDSALRRTPCSICNAIRLPWPHDEAADIPAAETSARRHQAPGTRVQHHLPLAAPGCLWQPGPLAALLAAADRPQQAGAGAHPAAQVLPLKRDAPPCLGGGLVEGWWTGEQQVRSGARAHSWVAGRAGPAGGEE